MLSITSSLRTQAEKRPVLWLLLGTLLVAPILMPLGALFLVAVLWSMSHGRCSRDFKCTKAITFSDLPSRPVGYCGSALVADF
jgi:hypothetical protein